MTTTSPQYKSMDRKTLKAKLDKNDQFHLLEKRAEDLVASKGETIVVYCGGRTCPSSKQAAQKLADLGLGADRPSSASSSSTVGKADFSFLGKAQ